MYRPVLRFVTGVLCVPPLVFLPFFAVPKGDIMFSGTIVELLLNLYGITAAGLLGPIPGAGIVAQIVIGLLVPTVVLFVVIITVMGSWIVFIGLVVLGLVGLIFGQGGEDLVFKSVIPLGVTLFVLSIPVVGPGLLVRPRIGMGVYAVAVVLSGVLRALDPKDV